MSNKKQNLSKKDINDILHTVNNTIEHTGEINNQKLSVKRLVQLRTKLFRELENRKDSIIVSPEYKVGQPVYVLYEGEKYNDLFRTETEWKILRPDTYRKEFDPYTISEIVVKCREKSTRVLYRVDCLLVSSENIFKTLEEAVAERNKRNKNN